MGVVRRGQRVEHRRRWRVLRRRWRVLRRRWRVGRTRPKSIGLDLHLHDVLEAGARTHAVYPQLGAQWILANPERVVRRVERTVTGVPRRRHGPGAVRTIQCLHDRRAAEPNRAESGATRLGEEDQQRDDLGEVGLHLLRATARVARARALDDVPGRGRPWQVQVTAVFERGELVEAQLEHLVPLDKLLGWRDGDRPRQDGVVFGALQIPVQTDLAGTRRRFDAELPGRVESVEQIERRNLVVPLSGGRLCRQAAGLKHGVHHDTPRRWLGVKQGSLSRVEIEQPLPRLAGVRRLGPEQLDFERRPL